MFLFCIRQLNDWWNKAWSSSSIELSYILIFLLSTFWVIGYFSRKFTKKKIVSNIYSGNQRGWSSDVIIVGSGILGSAMAKVLAEDGRNVIVIERNLNEPNRIVGELLQPGGVKALLKLGLNDCLEDFDACHVAGYVIHDLDTKSQVQIPYLKDETSNVLEGRAFHHGRFVMKLRQAAQNQSRVNYIEGTATKLIEENGIVVGIEYMENYSKDIKILRAPLTIICDGCFSRFRKSLIRANVSTESHFIGMIMKDCTQYLKHYAELILVKPSPVLVYQISSSETRVLIDIPGKMPDDNKGYLIDNIAPQLPDHLKVPFLVAVYNDQLRSMPNSFLPPDPIQKSGVIILGDAYNMRHPITGGGMSVALNDVLAWRNLFHQIPDLQDYDAVLKALKTFQNQRKNSYSFVVNILAQALYKLFSASDDYLANLKIACFEYFKLGGKCVSGPIGLLSVISPRPNILIGHFFAVVVYAIYVIFKREKWWALHRSISTSVLTFLRACSVLLPLIWTEVKTITFT